MPIKREADTVIQNDVYRDGRWWRHTGFSVLYDYGYHHIWWTEYKDSDGNIRLMN